VRTEEHWYGITGDTGEIECGKREAEERHRGYGGAQGDRGKIVGRQWGDRGEILGRQKDYSIGSQSGDRMWTDVAK